MPCPCQQAGDCMIAQRWSNAPDSPLCSTPGKCSMNRLTKVLINRRSWQYRDFFQTTTQPVLHSGLSKITKLAFRRSYRTACESKVPLFSSVTRVERARSSLGIAFDIHHNRHGRPRNTNLTAAAICVSHRADSRKRSWSCANRCAVERSDKTCCASPRRRLNGGKSPMQHGSPVAGFTRFCTYGPTSSVLWLIWPGTRLAIAGRQLAHRGAFPSAPTDGNTTN